MLACTNWVLGKGAVSLLATNALGESAAIDRVSKPQWKKLIKHAGLEIRDYKRQSRSRRRKIARILSEGQRATLEDFKATAETNKLRWNTNEEVASKKALRRRFQRNGPSPIPTDIDAVKTILLSKRILVKCWLRNDLQTDEKLRLKGILHGPTICYLCRENEDGWRHYLLECPATARIAKKMGVNRRGQSSEEEYIEEITKLFTSKRGGTKTLLATRALLLYYWWIGRNRCKHGEEGWKEDEVIARADEEGNSQRKWRQPREYGFQASIVQITDDSEGRVISARIIQNGENRVWRIAWATGGTRFTEGDVTRMNVMWKEVKEWVKLNNAWPMKTRKRGAKRARSYEEEGGRVQESRSG